MRAGRSWKIWTKFINMRPSVTTNKQTNKKQNATRPEISASEMDFLHTYH